MGFVHETFINVINKNERVHVKVSRGESPTESTSQRSLYDQGCAACPFLVSRDVFCHVDTYILAIVIIKIRKVHTNFTQKQFQIYDSRP